MSVANPWMLASPAPLTSHCVAGLPGSAFSAAISFDPTETLSARVAVCAPALTRTVGLETPVAVGVPEITPVLALRASPAGSVPLTIDHVYGGVPPVAASVAVYGVPTTPTGSAVVVIVNAPPAGTPSVVFPLTPPDVAEIVVVPTLTAVASPAALIVATPEFDDAHVT